MCAKQFFLLSLLVFLVDCHSNSGAKEEQFELREITDLPKEIKLPSQIWDLLEEKKIINSKGEIVRNPEPSNRFEENVFVGLSVKLREKSPGVLGGKHLEIRSPKSGLSIDLAHYVKSEKGTFRLSFAPVYKLDSGTAQVLFLSESISRAGNHQSLGSGCGKFYDVTKIYLREMQENGIEVNVTDGRHVSLLAGTFFIRVSNEKGVRALTQLTITDSRHPELQCDSHDGVDQRE